MPEAELAEAMRKLVEAELVFRRGTPPDATYLFKHALVRDAAYESLLKSRRQQLHLRLLDILEASGTAPPEILAQHAQAGSDAGRAVGWWHEAGQAAVGRAAFAEAEAHLENALALLPAIDDIAKRRRTKPDIAITRATLSLVRYGYGHERTESLYARAAALAQDTGDPRLIMFAKYGLWAANHVRDEVGSSLAVAEEMLETAHRSNDHQLTSMAHRLLGLSQTMAGRLTAALQSLEMARSLHDPERDKSFIATTGVHPVVGNKSYLAFAELALGFPDRARRTAEEAGQVAQVSGEVNTKAYAMWHAACLYALAGEAARAMELTNKIASDTKLHELQLWETMGEFVATWGAFLAGDKAGAANAFPRLFQIAEDRSASAYSMHHAIGAGRGAGRDRQRPGIRDDRGGLVAG